MIRENVLGGTKWSVGCDVWRGDRRRGVGVVRKHVGYGKRVAGKSLDLTVTLVIGNRIWGYSRDTSYVPCRDVRTGFITGKPCMNPIRYSLWAYIMENLYRPCCDVRIWVMTGTLNLFGHSIEIV